MTRDRLVPLVLAAAVVSACESPQEGADPAPTRAGTPGQSSRVAGECSSVAVGAVSGTAVIEPGPSNGLPRSSARGQPLVIDGAVVDNECEPAADATIRLWHTDARGAYGPAEDECCYYAGTVRADRTGRFRLRTVKPGRYAETNAPPAHIHLEVRHPAGGLNTEIVFAGEAGVPTVPVDGYAPVELQRRDGHGPSWYGEVTLVLGSGAG
jgi:protocatechuate 3,4-dioxygenase beta subunit